MGVEGGKPEADRGASSASGSGRRIALAIVGSGGAGVVTVGDLVLQCAARSGWYGLMMRSAGPQIRGGESAAYIVLGDAPVDSVCDRFDLLVAIDWNNAERFAAEIPLDRESLVISGQNDVPVPEALAGFGARVEVLDLKSWAGKVRGARPNMVALGLIASLLGLDAELLDGLVAERFGGKDEGVVAASLSGLALGREAVGALGLEPLLLGAPASNGARWLISGNQVTGLGALRGGIRFVAAYPITPATEILEWLAPRLGRVDGMLIQAEDELASINMAIGASFSGVPALTATSGPGLALMLEAIGLAVAAEVPVVIVDVMRGGPSTGIPTKSEQGDLNVAVHGLPGDAPHIVLAPTSIADCLFTTQWAVHLAETLQVPAIVLSDQAMGQATASIDPPANVAFASRRQLATRPSAEYRRFDLTESGVSPVTLPGMAGGQYTADGLEHTPAGVPSSTPDDHARQLDKRRDKLERFDFGQAWAQSDGSGPAALITWGSLYGPVRAAARRLDPAGKRIRVVAPRLLSPARPDLLAAALDGVERILVVEQSHGAQLYHHLLGHYGLDREARSYHRPGPLPLRPAELEGQIEEWIAS